MDFIQAMRQTIRQKKLIPANSRVICALSGGADSVSLLIGMAELAGEFDAKLSALHCNHGLRLESVQEAAFCQTLCEKLQIPLTAVSLDVKRHAAASGETIEEAARNLRYQAFQAEMERIGSAQKMEKNSPLNILLATAHTADDNAETLLFRLARGTGLTGLTGIPPRRPLGNGQVIRPLLSITRQQVETYLRQKRQPFVTDASNQDFHYARNRIRLEVLPALSIVNSAAGKAISESAELLRLDNEFLEQETERLWLTAIRPTGQAEKTYGLDGRILKKAHPALRRRCILRLLEENHMPLRREKVHKIEKMLEDNRGGTLPEMETRRIQLSGDVYCYRKRGILFISPADISDQRKSPAQL